MIKKIFIWSSPLPLLVFWGFYVYLMKFEKGESLETEMDLLLGSVIFSLLMGVAGLVLIVQARKRKEPVLNLWICTFMAGSLFLYVLAGVFIGLLTKYIG